MNLLFWIALKLRLRQKFWGDLYIWEVKRRTKKATELIDLDTSDITFEEIKD